MFFPSRSAYIIPADNSYVVINFIYLGMDILTQYITVWYYLLRIKNREMKMFKSNILSDE